MLDADLSRFFDTLDHAWLVKFVEHRIGHRRVVRLIQKWLKAGVLEDGKRIVQEVGTVQGGSISPLLVNLYLHYVFDLWVQQWRRREAGGDIVVVHFADDFVLGFRYRPEAEQFLDELRERLARFGLALHPEKIRLIQFGRYAAKEQKVGGQGKPETFNFLGFTHICGKTRQGNIFMLIRQTLRQRRPSSGKSKRSCAGACTTPSQSRALIEAQWFAGTCSTTACRGTDRRLQRFGGRSVVSGDEPSGDVARMAGRLGPAWNG